MDLVAVTFAMSQTLADTLRCFRGPLLALLLRELAVVGGEFGERLRGLLFLFAPRAEIRSLIPLVSLLTLFGGHKDCPV